MSLGWWTVPRMAGFTHNDTLWLSIVDVFSHPFQCSRGEGFRRRIGINLFLWYFLTHPAMIFAGALRSGVALIVAVFSSSAYICGLRSQVCRILQQIVRWVWGCDLVVWGMGEVWEKENIGDGVVQPSRSSVCLVIQQEPVDWCTKLTKHTLFNSLADPWIGESNAQTTWELISCLKPPTTSMNPDLSYLSMSRGEDGI